MIIPSIDIMDGKAVQLKQGKEKVLEKENIFELAEYFSKFGEIAVIDLDSAMGKGDNLALIKQLVRKYPCRVGGGIRTVEKAQELISAGAKRLIIGTAASENLLVQLPKEKIIVALDSKSGKVMAEGWLKDTGFKPEEFIHRFDNYCSGYLYTSVDHEGLMQGTDMEAIKRIRKLTEHDLTAAGGICTVEEILALEELGVSSQLGMCLYTDKLDLKDIFVDILNFEKGSGLIPTVVQDYKTKQVLMVAYSSPESLRKTFATGLATYFSRSRNEIWTKGETSGNIQKLVTARFDCDRDSLLFIVDQTGNACHKGRFSCFGDKEFSIKELYDVLVQRKKDMPENSYTTKLFKDKFYLKRKIMEEAFEVVSFEEGSGLEWETADLFYFIMTLMVDHDVTIDDIISNLGARRR